MQIRIQKVHANVQLPYVVQDAKRRRLELVVCRFHGAYAYVLMPKDYAQRIQGRFTVIIDEREKIPIMKQHMKLQMTGTYQTHQNVTHRYIAEVVAHEVRQAPMYMAI